MDESFVLSGRDAEAKAEWKQEAKPNGKTVGHLAGSFQTQKQTKHEKQRSLLDNECQVRAEASPPRQTPDRIAKAVR